jgi:hypothetical protein
MAMSQEREFITALITEGPMSTVVESITNGRILSDAETVAFLLRVVHAFHIKREDEKLAASEEK